MPLVDRHPLASNDEGPHSDGVGPAILHVIGGEAASTAGAPAYCSAMDVSETKRLQKDWEAKGNPPCEHPRLEKERMNGAQTGDQVCTTCGAEFWNGVIPGR